MLNELHGRPVPAATAAKIVNPELTIIAISGDGDGYGEGGNHFIHAANRNVDITYIVHNNQVYGLTKGQPSPTSDFGFTAKIAPEGAWVSLRPLALAVACDASFVARGFAGDIEHLSRLVKAGIQHKGFAFIEVLQPCVSFNHKNTYEWYRQRVYKVEEETGYDPTNGSAAFNKGLEWGDRIPIGVIHRKGRPVFEGYVRGVGKTSLVKQKIDPQQFETLLDEFM